MWLTTTSGFYSIVRKRDGIHVRSRSEDDIKNLIKLTGVKHVPIFTSRADYRWRIIVNTGELDLIIHKLAQQVKYNNFKDEIFKKDKKRERLYEQVWWLLREIERL